MPIRIWPTWAISKFGRRTAAKPSQGVDDEDMPADVIDLTQPSPRAAAGCPDLCLLCRQPRALFRLIDTQLIVCRSCFIDVYAARPSAVLAGSALDR